MEKFSSDSFLYLIFVGRILASQYIVPKVGFIHTNWCFTIVPKINAFIISKWSISISSIRNFGETSELHTKVTKTCPWHLVCQYFKMISFVVILGNPSWCLNCLIWLSLWHHALCLIAFKLSRREHGERGHNGFYIWFISVWNSSRKFICW